MFTEPVVVQLHQQIQKIFGHTPVLLGGSYVYGEATQYSDIDFYVLCSWVTFFQRKKYARQLAAVRALFPAAPISVMLVPRSFFKRGWYYIYGHDVSGQSHVSALNAAIIFRNSLKFGYYYLLKSRCAANQAEQTRAFQKSAHQLAIAQLFLISKNQPPQFFSRRYLFAKDESGLSPQLVATRQMLVDPVTKIAPEMQTELLQSLQTTRQEGDRYLHFFWPNLLMYLGKYKNLALGLNPDAALIQALGRGLQSALDPAALLARINQNIFPVIII